jgi:uncharacterized repeat protein (TIGR03803 family)
VVACDAIYNFVGFKSRFDMKYKTLLCAAVIILSCGFSLGQTQYKVLWSFAGSPNDGATPLSNLVIDRAGSLYGTTERGGTTPSCAGCGTVFKLSPGSDGTWAETILYNFCSDFNTLLCLDGSLPKAGLIIDAKGNLYGTTSSGGANACPFIQGGCGTVFELSPPSFPSDSWTETVLYNFCENYENSTCLDGALPVSQLTLDALGNLYGTTPTGGTGGSSGGCCAGGTVFELSLSAGGWTETVLHNFCAAGGICADGLAPQAGVTFDKLDNLYGTTERGGDYRNLGALYKLAPGSNGWTETVLRTSKQSQASYPLGTVSIDPFGNLYSTFSSLAGQIGGGGVFRLGPHGGGVDFSFSSDGSNGNMPAAGVLIDSKHPALYGTTETGGANNAGTVFKMVAPAQETVMYSFCSQPSCADGLGPLASLVEDASGNLYGTTKLGGANNQGAVFEIVQSIPKEKASQHPPVWPTILPSKK